MKKTYATRGEAYNAAFEDFAAKASERFFSGQFATHFYVQPLSNGTVSLVFGGGGWLPNPDGTYSSVSDVNGAFNMPMDAAASLVRVLSEQLSQAGQTDGQEG